MNETATFCEPVTERVNIYYGLILLYILLLQVVLMNHKITSPNDW